MSQISPFLTEEQSKIIFWITKIVGGISIFCSLYLIIKILHDRTRRKKVYHRIIVALSMNSILLSGAMFCNSWPTPKSYSIYGAVGTQRTCDAQGAVILFTAMNLSNYYLLLAVFAYHSVRNNFDETWFLKFELRIHISIYIIPTIFTVHAVVNEFINPLSNQCFLSSYPPGCTSNKKFGKCIRGEQGYQLFLKIGASIGCATVLIALMLFIGLVFYVRRKEKINSKLIKEKFEERFRGKELFREKARKKKSRIITQQALLYFMMYIFTILIPICVRISFLLQKDNASFFWIILTIFCPSLSGCINLIVYLLLLRRKPDPTHICSLPPLRDRIYLSPSQKKALNPPEEVSKTCLDRPEFSIFDGRNPSDSPWAQYIDEYSDDENYVNDFEIQETVP